MKNLSEFALVCLIFCGVSQFSFGQVDKTDKKNQNEKLPATNRQSKENEDETKREVPGEDRPYIYVEVLPRFPGKHDGMMEYLNANLRYPQKALQNNITGTVHLKFDILETGEVANVRVIEGVHRLLDKEAIRLIKGMPQWQPGTQNGKPVKVEYNFPLRFNHSSNSTSD